MRYLTLKSMSAVLVGYFAFVTQSTLASGVFAVASDNGMLSEAILYDGSNLSTLLDVHPYSSYTGGVRVASGDVKADGHPDLITTPGAASSPVVRELDGITGASLGDFYAFDPTFTDGVYVAVGDVNGDGYADIIVGAGAGGGPHVIVFSGLDHSVVLHNFYAYTPSFTGGVRVAAGDVNGDGHADIIVAPGPGASPDIKVFDGVTGSLIDEFFAYSASFTGGVFVAAADLNGDGHADIVTGADAGAVADVEVFKGPNHASLGGFLAYPAAFTGGVRVAAGDIYGDGKQEIVTATGPGAVVEIKAFAWPSLSVVRDIFPFSTFNGGAFVAVAPPNDVIFVDGFDGP